MGQGISEMHRARPIPFCSPGHLVYPVQLGQHWDGVRTLQSPQRAAIPASMLGAPYYIVGDMGKMGTRTLESWKWVMVLTC